MALYQMRQRDPLVDPNTQAALERRARELIGLGLMALATIFVAMLLSYSPEDPGWLVASDQPVSNWLGGLGAAISSTLMIIIGRGAWAIPLILFAWGLRFVLHRGADRAMSRMVFALIAVAMVSAFAATHVPGEVWERAHTFGLGGRFGDAVVGALLGVAPVKATFGLKLMSLLMGLAALAMLGFVTGVDREELLALRHFLAVGSVVTYSQAMQLAGRGGVGAVQAAQALQERHRQRRADAQALRTAEADLMARAPVNLSAPPPMAAAGARRSRVIRAEMEPPLSHHPEDDFVLEDDADWQPDYGTATPLRGMAAPMPQPAPMAEGYEPMPMAAPKKREGLLGRLFFGAPEPEIPEIQPAFEDFQMADDDLPPEDRIKARISDVIRNRVRLGKGAAAPQPHMTPLQAAIARREPALARRVQPGLRAEPPLVAAPVDPAAMPAMTAVSAAVASAAARAAAAQQQLAQQVAQRPVAPVVASVLAPVARSAPASSAMPPLMLHPAAPQPAARPAQGAAAAAASAVAAAIRAGAARAQGLAPQEVPQAGRPAPLSRPVGAPVAMQPAPVIEPVAETMAEPVWDEAPAPAPAFLRRTAPAPHLPEPAFGLSDDLADYGDDPADWQPDTQDDFAEDDYTPLGAAPMQVPGNPMPLRVAPQRDGALPHPAAPLVAPEVKRGVVQHPAKKPLQPSTRAVAEAQPRLRFEDQVTQEYELPPLSLLASASTVQRHALSDEALEENARMLESVLDDYGVKGEIVSVRPGPVVTMYELEPAPGLKASRVIGLADDIARSMSALSARVSTVPGRSVIGIELPKASREKVVLREILAARDFGDSNMRLPLALGKDIGGDPVVANLSKMPHLLIAGTTGSGKSVAINTMILSLLYKLTPEECRLIMIDPKMLELSVYDGIPHLLSPVVTDPKKAVVALKWVVGEMEERYRKMSKMGVRNIDGYNGRVREAQAAGEMFRRTIQTGFDEDTGEPVFETEEFAPVALPYIVVIVDEMADLMMVAGKEIEACIQRLAQMARASGIHLIMATQRPSVDVITGTIKANFPTRISFQVTSKIDSRTILGEQGAEQLLGQGDMLYMGNGARITRIHGPFVSDEEVEEIVNHLKSFGPPQYMSGVVEGPDDEVAGDIDAVLGLNAGGNTDGEDALYDQAVAIVARDRKCSTSYIQRKLGIGYNKAARLVEQMEEEGVVTPANHVGKREILIPEA